MHQIQNFSIVIMTAQEWSKMIQVVENFGSDCRLLCKLHKIWSVDSQENH